MYVYFSKAKRKQEGRKPDKWHVRRHFIEKPLESRFCPGDDNRKKKTESYREKNWMREAERKSEKKEERRGEKERERTNGGWGGKSGKVWRQWWDLWKFAKIETKGNKFPYLWKQEIARRMPLVIGPFVHFLISSLQFLGEQTMFLTSFLSEN